MFEDAHFLNCKSQSLKTQVAVCFTYMLAQKSEDVDWLNLFIQSPKGPLQVAFESTGEQSYGVQ